MSEKTVLEIKETLAGERLSFTCRLLHLAVDEAVLLYKLQRSFQIEDLVLPDTTLSLGYFWVNRPYNAYHWIKPEGQTLGLYLNISDQTRITAKAVSWRDLFVDLLVTPDGRCRVLDEDEVPDDIETALRRKIENTRDELVRQYRTLLSDIERRSAELLQLAQTQP